MRHRNVWTVLSLLVLATTVACGGGGEDAPAAAPAAPAAPAFDPRQRWQRVRHGDVRRRAAGG